MITFIIHSELRRRYHPAGYTLVEVMSALGLSMMVMVGVLSAFIMLGRSGLNVAHYSVSESEVRRALEEFSQDVRMARQIRWNSATSITLTVPDSYAASDHRVTYAFDSSTAGETARSFYRLPGDPASSAARQVFVREISHFQFSRFNRLNKSAGTDAETKRVQVTLNVRRGGGATVAANTTLVSASYMLRNKAIN